MVQLVDLLLEKGDGALLQDVLTGKLIRGLSKRYETPASYSL